MEILKLVDAVCLAGSNKNEDSIGYGKDFIFVIDGATGLRGVNIMGMRSDAEWFSRRLAEQLQIYLNNDTWSIQERNILLYYKIILVFNLIIPQQVLLFLGREMVI